MPEELRVFVRAALFIALISVVYRFVSGELAGTVLLLSLLVALVLVVVTGAVLGRAVRDARPRGGLVARLVGLEDGGGDIPAPLEVEEEPVVRASPWPLGVAVAAMLVGLGLLFGAWLWVPGAGLGLSVAYGWITQTDV
ncbi:MAG: cytochrome c oxidase subunit 4 [Actinomycetota bacterium]|nr:cytochrome c oxidase subunit 4 [Actinomycetota bacterium]